MHWRDKKGDILKQDTDTALLLGSQGRAQPRGGRNQIVVVIPFIWEEQRDLVGISTGVNCTELWLSPVISAEMKRRGVATVFWQPAFQREKECHKAWSPLNLTKLAFLWPQCQGAEHVMCKPKNYYYRIKFLWAKCELCDWPQDWGYRGNSTDLQGSQYWEGKTIQKAVRFPQSTPPPHIMATRMTAMAQGIALGFHGYGAPSPTVFPCGVGPLGWGNCITGDTPTFPFSTTEWRSEKPESSRELKKLVIQHYLPENNRNTSS